MKVVLLNGPPGSGKDEACNAIIWMFYNRPNIVVKREKFAKPLKAGLAGILDLSVLDVEVTKELIDPILKMRRRDVLISMSEEWLKEKFGQQVFGHLMVNRLKRWQQSIDFKYETMREKEEPIAVITDSGFDYEATPVLDYVGKENCLLVRCTREGKDFSDDSRGYIYLPCDAIDLNNNGTIEQWHTLVKEAVEEWLERR